MGETIIFLFSVVTVLYALYWFWKNDDGLGAWDRKRPFDPHNRGGDDASR